MVEIIEFKPRIAGEREDFEYRVGRAREYIKNKKESVPGLELKLVIKRFKRVLVNFTVNHEVAHYDSSGYLEGKSYFRGYARGYSDYSEYPRKHRDTRDRDEDYDAGRD